MLKSTLSSLLNTFKATKHKIGPSCGIKSQTRYKKPPKKMYRVWRPTNAIFNVDGTDQQYKLLSYNILAQDLLVEHLYLYVDVDTAYLRWEHRLHRLKDEILHLRPDILCLQEMQYNHIKGFVKLIRGNRNLEYVYKKKTGHRTDGCAIIYDKAKFRLIEDRSLEYFTPGVRTLNRENVAIMAKFATKDDPSKEFIVATTHLLYNPKRQDVRMAQVEVLMEALNEFANDKENMPLPVLLTGDFNFETNSRPYNILVSNDDAEPRSSSNRTNCQRNDDNGATLANQLRLLPISFGDETASTFQDDWTIVDFILHSIDEQRDKVTIWSTYQLPLLRDCWTIGRMPNRYLGSDHFSLAITFSIC